MCEWFLYQIHHDPLFLTRVLFSDEANFYTNGVVNKQKIRYWAQENPHWYAERKEQGAARVMVWLGVFNQNLVGPSFLRDQLLVTTI